MLLGSKKKNIGLKWFHNITTQPGFTCSKFRIERLEQGVKCVQSSNKDTTGVVLASLLLILNIFTPC